MTYLTREHLIKLRMAALSLRRDDFGNYTYESLREFWGLLGYPKPNTVLDLIEIVDRAIPPDGPV